MTNKGKMVYCEETFQLFPSAKAAADYHKIGYSSVAKNAEGKISVTQGKHFAYVENTADIAKLFSNSRKMEKQNELMRKEAEERLAKLQATQKEIAKELAEARKLMKKYM